MNLEAISTIVFIGALLLIPFGVGVQLSRALRRRRNIETLLSEKKFSVGRVIGYTKRRNDTENIGDYFMIIEYTSDEGELVWAEGDSCDKDALAIDSAIDIMIHPLDKRAVVRVLSKDHLKMLAGFEKNIELLINLVITVIIAGSVIYYKGLSLNILIPLILTYAVGLVFGTVFTGEKSDKRMSDRITGSRNERLIAAQANGEIPCYIHE